ncbi:MAG: tetratricopeptide repeat protein [Acetobacteraceae bacterium]
MLKDRLDLPLSTGSAGTVAAFDHAIDGYLGYRSDLMRRLEALLKQEPDFGMAHVFKGYMMMAGYRADLLPAARAAAETANRFTLVATPREQAHAAALAHWVAGDAERAIAVWDQILDEHPHDILAFRLAHFINFWLGRPEAMLASVLQVERAWSPDQPGYVAILGCRCFAHEESGYYLEAEHAGREAIRRDPTDLWAAHGVAHVLEMTGRRREGIDWVTGLQERWDGGNNLKHHLWWHQAMYHLELGETDKVLALYDAAFRDMASPLTTAAPDLYIDVQNAASMLYRLGRHGIPAGDRWTELADKAEARIGDCQSVFTLPHWMMALAATGRDTAAQRMLGAMEDFAAADGPLPALVKAIGLPVTRAVLANGQGRHADAVAHMRPIIGDMYRLGGSHAQQDVLEQVYLDSALKAGADDDVRLILERVSGRHPVPPARRRGYAMAAGMLAA